MTMLVAVVITENSSGRKGLLWLWGQKTRDRLKAIEGPIQKLEHKCQVSQKIQFFLLMMDLDRSETCRVYK